MAKLISTLKKKVDILVKVDLIWLGKVSSKSKHNFTKTEKIILTLLHIKLNTTQLQISIADLFKMDDYVFRFKSLLIFPSNFRKTKKYHLEQVAITSNF